MASVTINNVFKQYGDVPVIRGVNIEIADGEFVILVGPSGCGKSTLLRMIAGLEGITSGKIAIDGRVINDVQPKDRDIAMVFQSYALYPHMTVEQNMAFSLRIKGLSETDIAPKVQRAAEILDLRPLLSRYPKQLSGGQRQRVAMGRAIVRDPKVFLFDEPLSNLDAKLRVQMRSEIKALHRRLETTTIYVTHDQIEAMTMADKIVVMNGGLVEQVGRPLDLYDRPQNLFVAGFIGSPAMNLVRGVVSGAAFEVSPGVTWMVPDGFAHAGEVVYGVRPEDIRIVGNGGMGAVVEAIEPSGSETQLSVLIGSQLINIVSHDRIDFAPGDAINVQFDLDKVHLFDATSGQKIAT